MKTDSPTTRLLLVEDDAIITLVESHILAKAGYEVICACSGEEGLAKFVGDPDIDLAILDVDMGRGMDGIETARALLATREFPLLFLTSCPRDEVDKRAQGIAHYGYVCKHGNDDILLSAIAALLEHRESDAPIDKPSASTMGRWVR